MTYNMFGGTLSLTQSVNQSCQNFLLLELQDRILTSDLTRIKVFFWHLELDLAGVNPTLYRKTESRLLTEVYV